MNDPKTEEQAESQDEQVERRRQGIRIKLPGGTEIAILGPTTILSLLLVLTGVNSWIGWTLVDQMAKLAGAVERQAASNRELACVTVLPVEQRQQRYEECKRLFGR